MGQQGFLVIAVTKRKHSDGMVFEDQHGLRFVVSGANTRTEADAKLSTAGADAKIFAVRPDFSMPAPAWIAADPSFREPTTRKRS